MPDAVTVDRLDDQHPIALNVDEAAVNPQGQVEDGQTDDGDSQTVTPASARLVQRGEGNSLREQHEDELDERRKRAEDESDESEDQGAMIKRILIVSIVSALHCHPNERDVDR